MASTVLDAKNNAYKIRYSEDVSHIDNSKHVIYSSHVKDKLYRSGLEINSKVTPVLAKQVDRVCERLFLPRTSVNAFVYSSTEIQAESIIENDSECVVRFTSGLINLLNADEFAFVSGHEIGHFLLDHSIKTSDSFSDNIEHFMLQRSQEITADRLGLIACSDLNHAVRALMKTISGLDESHIRFDISTFVSQLSKISKPGTADTVYSSHPAMIIRCKALIWFAIGRDLHHYPDFITDADKQRIDSQVQKDLSKYVDGAARDRLVEIERELSMWKAAEIIAADGRFTKDEQNKFEHSFGADCLNKMKTFLAQHDRNKLMIEIGERLNSAKTELERQFPSQAETITYNAYNTAYTNFENN